VRSREGEEAIDGSIILFGKFHPIYKPRRPLGSTLF
jgi:hypothetical protein